MMEGWFREKAFESCLIISLKIRRDELATPESIRVIEGLGSP